MEIIHDNSIQFNTPVIILPREHHANALFCWKIRLDLKRQAHANRILNYVTYFWHTHLKYHFRAEEEYIFQKVNADLCRKAWQQHRGIRALIKQVNSSKPAPPLLLLKQLADAVEAHIAYEEKELFPHLEKVLKEQELLRIRADLERSHGIPVKDHYQDEF
jgi:hemerythrin-like domain-containing protein